jgi:NADH dehydrogenase/NADH:ubiquinone oxidoreductase subunit G
MSEKVLEQVAGLLKQANDLYMQVQQQKWEMENNVRETRELKELMEKKVDSKKIQESINQAILEKVGWDKVKEQMLEIASSEVKRTLGDEWNLEHNLSQHIEQQVRRELLNHFQAEIGKLDKTFTKIVKDNLEPVLEKFISEFAANFSKKAVAKEVLKIMKKQIETVPEELLENFKWAVKDDP